MQYSPYGSLISSTLTVSPTDRLYTGQRREQSLGLYDYRARFYDPLVGSFISPDTIVPELDNPAAWNRYSYVYGNPVKFNDPSGHCPAPEIDICNDPYKPLRDLWNHVFGPDNPQNRYPEGPNRSVFVQLAGAVEGDLVPGLELTSGRTLAFNFAEGDLTLMRTISINITGSTPEGVSGNAGMYFGTAKTSSNENFLGPAQIYGGNVAADLFAQMGIAGEVSQSLEDFWTDPEFWQALLRNDLDTASFKATQLAIDPVTGEPVTAYSAGPFVGVNLIQNSGIPVEVGVSFSPGTNYTWKTASINIYPWTWFKKD